MKPVAAVGILENVNDLPPEEASPAPAKRTIPPEYFVAAYADRDRIIKKARREGARSDADAEMLGCWAFNKVLQEYESGGDPGGKPYSRMNRALRQAFKEYREHRIGVVCVLNSDPKDKETDEEKLDRKDARLRERGHRVWHRAAQNWYTHLSQVMNHLRLCDPAQRGAKPPTQMGRQDHGATDEVAS